jgi:transposase-like protein
LGVKVATSETKQAWSAFFADLVARGLSGVCLVTSDAHAGLVDAIAANLPGAGWQRCRTHYAANLMQSTPKSAWPAAKTMLHSVYDEVDTAPVNAQFDKPPPAPKPASSTTMAGPHPGPTTSTNGNPKPATPPPTTLSERPF